MNLANGGPNLLEQPERIAGWLARMTLAEKIGQLLMVGFSGPTPPGELCQFLSSGSAGGIILFTRNVGEPDQVAGLTARLQEAAARSRLALPLFIAVDQEGGSVIRLSRGVTVFPGNMALGATGRADYAYRSARAVAAELAALGINMNLAPVLDVNSNPANPIIGIRSFSADPETVARLGTATIKGLTDGGVLATAKHFPGHGDTTVDSHLNLPVIPHGAVRLDTVELRPFQAAIAAGVSCIMTAHVVFPAIEPTPGRPATLSGAVLTDLLRRRLGFQGLIMTDCLEMNAIAAHYEIGDAVTQALLAGADQLLISHSFAKQQAAHQALLERVAQGVIPLERIDAAVTRVLTFKLALGVGEAKPLGPVSGRAAAGTRTHRELAQSIAEASLTLVRNRRQWLPVRLSPGAEVLILSFQKPLTVVEENRNGLEVDLVGAVSRYHQPVVQKTLVCDPAAELRQQIRAELAAKPPALIIAATQDAAGHPGQVELIKELAAGDVPLVVVALRTPYDLLAFPEVDTYLAAYGFRQVTLEAVAKLLWGEITPGGKLPVELPGLYPRGYGMDHF